MGVTIPSPCVGICFINDDTKLCEGCGRTLEEIANWSKMSNFRRYEILEGVNGRSNKVP